MARLTRSTRLATVIVIVLFALLIGAVLAIIGIQNQRIDNLHTALAGANASNSTLQNNYVKLFNYSKKHGVQTSTVLTPDEIEKLKGKDGANGLNGETGPEGPPGPEGAVGATGASGTNGADGAAGTNGADGTNGKDGATGATGPQGAPGQNGADGATGATGATGAQGVSVTSIQCESDGTWLVTYSDGTTSKPNGTCTVIPTTGSSGQ